MATVYYPSFDCVRIDAKGFRVSLPSLTVNVTNVTTSSSLGTLVSDSHGIIAQGSFTATAGDVIEISHGTYPLKCRFTLADTQANAYLRPGIYNTVAYVAQNLYTATTTSPTAEVYVSDRDHPEIQPMKLTDAKANATTAVP